MNTRVTNKKLVALLSIVVILLAGFLIFENSFVKTNQVTTSASNEIQLKWEEAVVNGVSNEEKELIVSFIDTFERAIAQKDTEKVLSFFSEPETDEEREDLDFILGSDYARDRAKPLARLFTTAGYNFDLSAHYVRKVSAQDANRQVVIDELRVIPSGGEFVGYSAKVSRLVVELRKTSHGYEIVRYYHEDIDQNVIKKYEGFIAK